MLRHFDSITARFFRFLDAKFQICLFFYEQVRLQSIKTPIDKLFPSTPPVASSRICWSVYTCFEYAEAAEVPYFVFYVHSVMSCGPYG